MDYMLDNKYTFSFATTSRSTSTWERTWDPTSRDLQLQVRVLRELSGMAWGLAMTAMKWVLTMEEESEHHTNRDQQFE